jgi:transposase-like protein
VAETDLLAHFTFPETHRSRIRSTNPLERLNKEIPVLDWPVPEWPRRRLVRWVTVPGPDSKEISGATSTWWLSAA